ncbi:hypothetical protein A8A01_10725 [Ewingella americana]|nr:hypothetical protein A8A01_10725 [Ewingella americana]
MSNHDQLHRYLFNHHAVRGELVSLKETFREIVAGHDYPAEVRNLLGEMLVATSLLTATVSVQPDAAGRKNRSYKGRRLPVTNAC